MASEDVEIYLTGSLARYLPEGSSAVVRVAAGRPLLEVAAGLGIPPRQPLVALANGMTVDLTYVLLPGDRIRLMPPIAGGCP